MARIIGTGDPNYLAGTDTADTIAGRAGDDTLVGWGGDDRLWGDAGDDWLYDDDNGDRDGMLPFGNDQLHGGDGNDHIEGSVGNDRLWGDAGNDFLADGQGANYLSGGPGDDQVYGVGRLLGGAGLDVLGAWGTSSMNGGSGADTFHFSQSIADGVADTITIADFRPAQGDKLVSHVHAPWLPDVDAGAWLFDAFDTDRDGAIRGNGTDLFSAATGRGLELHNWEDTVILVGVQEIARADWLVG